MPPSLYCFQSFQRHVFLLIVVKVEIDAQVVMYGIWILKLIKTVSKQIIIISSELKKSYRYLKLEYVC